jgi:MinD-like ATPase involved in chromosome partitioning or flagellar assembly/acid stress-induced BolA-like protein IbaG/YrbA
MTRENIRSIIINNLNEAGFSFKEDGLRVMPDPFSGWRIVVVSAEFEGKSSAERKNIILKGLEGLQIEWLELITPTEQEWAGSLAIDSELDNLPLWPEALARGKMLEDKANTVFPSELDEDIEPPIIATFYSLRGGVGRSTALAYTAHILAARGRKVISVDMDLEAPGLATLFGKEAEIGEGCGLVPLLVAIDNGEKPDISKHLLRVSEFEDLYCLPAGKPDANYARLLRYIDPIAWYHEERNPLHLFIEQLKTGLPFTPDVILLDARTGISALNGPLLFDLADMSIIVFFPHPQAQMGTAALTQALLAAKTHRDYNNHKQTLTPEPRFLVSPMPTSRVPEIMQRYQNRAIEWIVDWLSVLKSNNAFTESEVTHFVHYNEAIATSDKILEDKELWQNYEPITEWVERFLPSLQAPANNEITTQKNLILQEVSFSGGTAEYQKQFLKTFVETDLIKKALNATTPLVLGRKGTGKTAIFRRIVEDSNYSSIIISAPSPLVKEELSWLLNIDGFREIERILTNIGADWRQFWTLYTAISIHFGWNNLSSRPNPDPTFATLMPDYLVTIKETVNLIKTLLAIEGFGLIVNDWLMSLDKAASKNTYLLLDGLDTGFGSSDEDRKRRRKSLEGLFAFFTDKADQWQNLRFKILLREDIWRSLKFENKSHLFGRYVSMKWHDQVAFIKVALKQALQSKKFKKLHSYLGNTPVDNWSQQEVYSAWNLLVGERMKGGKTAFTRNWLWNRLADGNKDQSPRYLLQLMHEAVIWEKKQHATNPYERSIVRPRSLIEVFPTISEQAVQALREEFVELEPLMQQLTNIGYTPINVDELKVDTELVNFATEIGLLSIYEGTEENVKRYKVPDLFIHGLKMTRKGQK